MRILNGPKRRFYMLDLSLLRILVVLDILMKTCQSFIFRNLHGKLSSRPVLLLHCHQSIIVWTK
jgi:hypothetical protein